MDFTKVKGSAGLSEKESFSAKPCIYKRRWFPFLAWNWLRCVFTLDTVCFFYSQVNIHEERDFDVVQMLKLINMPFTVVAYFYLEDDFRH
jgi:hypothetical protein